MLKLFSLCYHTHLGIITTISKDRVKPSPIPDSWKLTEILATGVVPGSYMAQTTIIFFWAMKDKYLFYGKLIYIPYFTQYHHHIAKILSVNRFQYVGDQVWFKVFDI
jgi:hypothetical protein